MRKAIRSILAVIAGFVVASEVIDDHRVPDV